MVMLVLNNNKNSLLLGLKFPRAQWQVTSVAQLCLQYLIITALINTPIKYIWPNTEFMSLIIPFKMYSLYKTIKELIVPVCQLATQHFIDAHHPIDENGKTICLNAFRDTVSPLLTGGIYSRLQCLQQNYLVLNMCWAQMWWTRWTT